MYKKHHAMAMKSVKSEMGATDLYVSKLVLYKKAVAFLNNMFQNKNLIIKLGNLAATFSINIGLF